MRENGTALGAALRNGSAGQEPEGGLRRWAAEKGILKAGVTAMATG